MVVIISKFLFILSIIIFTFIHSFDYNSKGLFEVDRNHKQNKTMSYEKLLRRLYKTNLIRPVKLGLENMETLNALLGRPLDKMNVIHVAGTNGKVFIYMYCKII
jgi:hypothetical protein